MVTRAQGRRRIVIEKVTPELDGGRYPIKRVVGESVTVEADVLADGHDVLSGLLLYRREGESRWNEVPLGYPDNDRWRASFVVSKPGRYRYTVTAWVDSFQSWYRDLGKRLDAGQDVSIDLLIGATLIKEASARARGEAAKRLAASADALHSETKQVSEKVELIRDRSLHTLMADHPDRKWGTTYEKELLVTVDRERARFSAWYEMFPRSCSATPEQHGTFRDCEAWLPYIAGMGFDVLYFSPIHPIGQTHRKGKNNAPTCLPGDVGSPWAIGSHEGGHKAIHPQLGTLADFKRLLAKAKQHGIEVALDIAYQCSPDHPYVKDHPEWFRKRPDGTVQYAENPPKKYQDIYPLDFENEDWKGLWKEMTSIVLYWSKQGVRIFRVDNPHTKPFRFWEHLIARARGEAAKRLAASADALHSETKQVSEKVELIRDRSLHTLMADHPDRKWGTTYEKELLVTVDRERARFSAWYEMFPRSCSATPEQHGTFRDCEAWLPYIAGMGFDVLYFSPIHPIGQTHRKGKNNAPTCLPGDVGSPWAIGSHEGGHKAIHPQLGTLADFKRLLAKAKQHGIEVALDIAYQCSPDHPYVKDHPEWFRKRPDGTVQYAENPPKKYQDIYPLDFENEDWKGLWKEMTSIVLYWSKQGVRIFRVDNPHTKPFRFWEHLIVEVKHRYPDVIFLSEAFTRPKVMYNLAKLGFTQSYTYFTWRHTKGDFTQYLTELTQTEIREYFRPNFWPNTPDILIEHLQTGGRPAFAARLIMAATMCSNYGIYGPAFELGEHRPFAPGSEEYLNSEKYELKQWDIERPDSLKDLITAVNRIRRENPALQTNAGLHFHSVDNEQLLCYTKQTEDLSNIIFVVVNLDRHSRQAGAVDLNLAPLGLSNDQPYHLQDLLTGASYRWRGARNYVEVEAEPVPAQIFQVRR